MVKMVETTIDPANIYSGTEAQETAETTKPVETGKKEASEVVFCTVEVENQFKALGKMVEETGLEKRMRDPKTGLDSRWQQTQL